MNHYDILIATPGHSLEAQYVKSLTDTIEVLNKKGISYKWLNAYSSLVHNARELTATGGVGKNLNPLDKGPMGDSVTYNKMFWIDSDIAWSPEDFLKLYNSKHEIISGVYLLADGTTTSVHNGQFPGGIPINEIKSMTESVEVQSIGFGFVAISSGVFEKMQRPWFGHYPQRIPLPNNSSIETYLGEDISWCINAKNSGAKIYLDPTVQVGHMKKVAIEW